MAVNEIRERLRQQLEEDYGVDGAAILMDRPPGGWSDLVTKDYLDAKLSAVDAKFDALGARFDAIDTKFDALRSDFRAETATLSGAVNRRLRAQTWITTSVLIAGLTLAFTAGRLA